MIGQQNLTKFADFFAQLTVAQLSCRPDITRWKFAFLQMQWWNRQHSSLLLRSHVITVAKVWYVLVQECWGVGVRYADWVCAICRQHEAGNDAQHRASEPRLSRRPFRVDFSRCRWLHS